jgi:hypothetical protein
VRQNFTRGIAILSLLVLVIPAFMAAAGPSLAQEETRLFPETGKTVKGRFLRYWLEHGGLAQQGYPISNEMQEVSDTDGKTYTVQYFERAVFEYHPDEKPEFQVLLSLLGTFFYQARYGSTGAPNQTPNNEAGSVLVPETGKRLGGIFLRYWREHGGLAQQGYPVSDEFNEVSDLNGQTYKVQYFQRAVFEYHPEEKPEFQVLLSQLGTFQYRKKYLQPAATAVPATPTTAPVQATAVPTNTPAPQATAVPPTASPCSDVPPSQKMAQNNNCATRGYTFQFIGQGFTPGERVGAYLTDPHGDVFGAQFQLTANGAGLAGIVSVPTDSTYDLGIWALSMEGVDSHSKAIGYFKLIP